mgnify:CR=1 FL=1
MLPHLRAFGRSLCGNADLADDLVQETMLKAWKARVQYVPGPASMKSWAFVILRNCFLSQMRRKKFTAEYDELAAERLLVAPDDQDDSLHLADVQRALLMLPVDQREALVFIERAPRLIRPANYPKGTPGRGAARVPRIARIGPRAPDPAWECGGTPCPQRWPCAATGPEES